MKKLGSLGEMMEKIFISSERLQKFQWNFLERCDLLNIKKSCSEIFLQIIIKISVAESILNTFRQAPLYYENGYLRSILF